MSDRELLELAAKAAGYEFKWEKPRGSDFGWLRIKDGDRWPTWRPLTDDGEALRLAVKLGFGLHYESQFLGGETHRIVEVHHSHEDDKCQCEAVTYTDDPFAATRRAIVRAAAEIGRRPVSGM